MPIDGITLSAEITEDIENFFVTVETKLAPTSVLQSMETKAKRYR